MGEMSAAKSARASAEEGSEGEEAGNAQRERGEGESRLLGE